MTDTPERALLRRLVELTGKRWLSRKGARALSGGVPYETGKFTDWEVSLDYAVDEVRRIAAEARALLAEPEGEVWHPTPDEIEAGTRHINADPLAAKVCNWMVEVAKHYNRPTSRSRAEAEAMVEAYKNALLNALLMYYDRDRTIMHAEPSRAALLRALTGEDA